MTDTWLVEQDLNSTAPHINHYSAEVKSRTWRHSYLRFFIVIFFPNGRKRRCPVHLYLQSTISTSPSSHPGFISSQVSRCPALGASKPVRMFPLSTWMTFTGRSLIWLVSSRGCTGRTQIISSGHTLCSFNIVVVKSPKCLLIVGTVGSF